MAKKVINIDPAIWIPQHIYAKKLKVSNQVIHNWVKREQIEYWYIKDWDLRLVKVGSEKNFKNS